MRVVLLHGPNLDLLGVREPEVYGTMGLAELEAKVRDWGARLGLEVEAFQSNDEAKLIEAIHNARGALGVVLNPGALGHTSRALADAITSVAVPTVEVHISNVKAREPWRRISTVAPACVAVIYGRGPAGYRDALRHLVNRAAMPYHTIPYGPDGENLADARLPAGEARGAALLLHGGFWRDEYRRDTMESLAVDLTSRGLVTWNAEYRRLGGGSSWPGPGHDAETALLAMMRAHPGLPTVAIGHSAGAYLALWAGARHGVGTVGLAPVVDLGALASTGGVGAQEAESLLLGGAPVEVGSGTEDLFAGSEDTLVPPAPGATTLPGVGHFDFLDPGHSAWAAVMRAVEGLIGP